jgi:hypothetical protein
LDNELTTGLLGQKGERATQARGGEENGTFEGFNTHTYRYLSVFIVWFSFPHLLLRAANRLGAFFNIQSISPPLSWFRNG